MVSRPWVNTIHIVCSYAWNSIECWSCSGLLARMKWYRVVLDEAQFVRNRSVYHIPCRAAQPNLVLQGHSGQQSRRPTSF
jgi:hypothetical protein